MATIYTTTTASVPAANERAIVSRFKNPARTAMIILPDTAWQQLTIDGVPTAYRAILEAVLDNAAKTILSKHLNSYTVWPGELDSGYFAPAALLDEATGANSEWMTKDEIETAWRASETRKAWVTSPNYQANQAFRKAVAHYETLILKLAGKTSAYTPNDLDLILAKMKEGDLTTELGSFVVRRIEALRNKPAPAEVDCDLL